MNLQVSRALGSCAQNEKGSRCERRSRTWSSRRSAPLRRPTYTWLQCFSLPWDSGRSKLILMSWATQVNDGFSGIYKMW